MAKKKYSIPKIIQIDKPSVRSVAILMVSSIVVLQIASWLMTQVFDIQALNIHNSLLLMVLGAAVYMPYRLLDGTPGMKISEIAMVIGVIVLDVLILGFIIPSKLPTLFTPAVQSMLGIP
jgi:hypothetical protein